MSRRRIDFGRSENNQGPTTFNHLLYLALGQDKAGREEAYRALVRATLDEDPIGELRMALNQNQPIGNARF